MKILKFPRFKLLLGEDVSEKESKEQTKKYRQNAIKIFRPTEIKKTTTFYHHRDGVDVSNFDIRRSAKVSL